MDLTRSSSPDVVSSEGAGRLPTFGHADVVGERYRILRFIAQGGMGEVYEVEDLELGGRVALKTVRLEMSERESVVRRFKREIQLARQVTHPNVSRIFDLGRHTFKSGHGGIAFLTMELLEGETLSQRLKRGGRLSLMEALPIARQMAAALAAAHDLGIVHRDFKSSNVILVRSRSGERAVVTDFGLARSQLTADSGSAAASLTGTGDILGTPAYMAPEQVTGGREAGPAADIYALGVVLFEMVTGSWPFVGDSPLSIAAKRLQEKPRSPKLLVPDLDPVWTATILRCLEREPEKRFQSALDVVRALEGERVAPPPGRWRPRPAALAISLALAVAIAAALAVVARRDRGLEGVAPTASPAGGPAAPARLDGPRRAVAVLGFKNLGRPDAAWMSTALSEILRTELASGEKLRTIPAETVERLKADLALTDTSSLARDTLARVRSITGADLVVLGSYIAEGRPGAATVRLNARVQDTHTGDEVAAAPVTGTEQDVIRLATDAGARLRSSLHLGEMAGDQAAAVRASLPANPEAARLYAEGLDKLRDFDALTARDLLTRAASREPTHPLIHAALGSALSALGYDAKARQETGRARELARTLPDAERRQVEALHHETTADWDKAVQVYRELYIDFPDRIDYGLRLAEAQARAGRADNALATVEALRKLSGAQGEDARIDLAEAAAAKAQTDFPRQLEAAGRAREKAQAQGTRLVAAQARFLEGSALVDMERLDEGRAACDEAGQRLAAAGDRAGAARAQNCAAIAQAQAGDLAGARQRFQEALVSSREIGDQRSVAKQLTNLGNVEAGSGRPAEARKLYEQSVGVAREIGDTGTVARGLNNIATILFESNQHEEARKTYEKALASWQEVGESVNVATALDNLGEVLRKQGRLPASRARYEESLKTRRQVGDAVAIAETLVGLAATQAELGDFKAAQASLDEALALARGAKDGEGEAAALEGLAALAERTGDPARARALRDQAGKSQR